MIHEIFPRKYDPEYTDRRAEDGDHILSYEKDGILVKYTSGTAELPTFKDLESLLGSDYAGFKENAYYLFKIDNDSYYENELPGKLRSELPFCKEMPDEEEKTDFFYIKIHYFRELNPVHMVFAGATGYHIRNWKRTVAHCGVCGGTTSPSKTERAFVCDNCSHAAYPVISPAVIVAITNGNKLLLVRNLRRPKNVRLELVSGYVEIGESFEDAVHREVMEEVGLKVKNVRFYKDQPWGISGAHMIGFYADVDGDDAIVRQEDEISEAKWYEREEIPEYRNRLSVGSEMILKFKTGEYPKG
ncbi:MAG: NAD(+) diphosphatase [Lachnospiraceae bacterium]|nr:NAD(+) diphosphatase [Lachnospiraceae bacterium]